MKTVKHLEAGKYYIRTYLDGEDNCFVSLENYNPIFKPDGIIQVHYYDTSLRIASPSIMIGVAAALREGAIYEITEDEFIMRQIIK